MSAQEIDKAPECVLELGIPGQKLSWDGVRNPTAASDFQHTAYCSRLHPRFAESWRICIRRRILTPTSYPPVPAGFGTGDGTQKPLRPERKVAWADKQRNWELGDEKTGCGRGFIISDKAKAVWRLRSGIVRTFVLHTVPQCCILLLCIRWCFCNYWNSFQDSQGNIGQCFCFLSPLKFFRRIVAIIALTRIKRGSIYHSKTKVLTRGMPLSMLIQMHAIR